MTLTPETAKHLQEMLIEAYEELGLTKEMFLETVTVFWTAGNPRHLNDPLLKVEKPASWTIGAAKILRPAAIWIHGEGKYASVSDCPPGSTVMLFETRRDAETAKAQIDSTACGGGCIGKAGHKVICLEP